MTSAAQRIAARLLPPRLVGTAWAHGRDVPEPVGGSPIPRGGDPVLIVLAPIAWEVRPQRPQRLTRELARRGFQTYYVSPTWQHHLVDDPDVRRVDDGVYEVAVPVPRATNLYVEYPSRRTVETLTAWVNQRVASAESAVIGVMLPTWVTVAIAARAGVSNTHIWYDCMDLWSAFPATGRVMAKAERILAKQADVVTATSPLLAERVGRWNDDVHLLPNAVDDHVGAQVGAIEIDSERRPQRVGYLGALDRWFDTDLCRQVAAGAPDIVFELVGRVDDPAIRRLARLPNVEFTGEISASDVPAALARFDAAFVPFRSTKLVGAVDGVKLYEFRAAGLQTVVTGLQPSSEHADGVTKVHDATSAIQALRGALDRGRAQPRPVATWADRADSLATLLRSAPPTRSSTPDHRESL